MVRPRRHWVLAGLAGGLLVGCHGEKPETVEVTPPVTVRTERVVAGVHPALEEVVGTVEAKLFAAIEPKVSARIEEMAVVPGQRVQQGDLIARLDAREIQARLDQAEAVLDQANRDLERTRKLVERRVTAASEMDAVLARQRVAEGAVREAQAMLGYARVTAPFAGVITRKRADVGDLAAPGRAIVEMEDPQVFRMVAHVPEALIDRVVPGGKLSVVTGSRAEPLEGIVAEVEPAADAASRTFSVKLDLPAIAGLRSGQFGRVLVPVGESRSLRVPAAALVSRGQLEILFVVGADNRAHLRLVRTGKKNPEHVEILSGLEAGETLVVENAETLRDGQPVVAP